MKNFINTTAKINKLAIAGLVLQLAIPNAVYANPTVSDKDAVEDKTTYQSNTHRLTFSSTPLAQEQQILTGTVTDESGMPLPGVSVVEKGTTNGTATDFDGNYTITLRQNSTIVFSFMGFLTREVTVGNEERIDVSLTEDVSTLDEVVVVGYGQNVRRNLTTAVSSVKPSDVPDRNVASANQLLQGQVAGVNLTTSNGTPGGASRVSIRGVSSINGDNEPLYVIDGIPLSKASASYNFSGEYRQDPLSMINPSDIETIDVLKDAAATAIYGSRGTNGVIMITTKQGRKGEPTVSLNHLSGMSFMPKKLDLLNPQEFIAMQTEATNSFNSDMGYTPGSNGYIDLDNVLGVVPEDAYNVNWQDMIIRDHAFTTQTDLSFSGGNDHVTYFTSAGYQHQQGMIKESSLKRYSIRSNVDYKPNDIFNFGVNLNGNYTKSTSIPNGDQGTALFQRSLEQRPYDRPLLPDGSYSVGGKDILRHNALIILEQDHTEDKNFQGLVNAYAGVNFLNHFTFRTSYNTEIRLGNGHRRQGFEHPYNPRGYVNDVRNYRYSGTFDNTLTFTKTWNDLDVEAMAGHSFYEDVYNFNQATGTEFPSDDFKHITAATIRVGNEDESRYSMESYIGRLSLNFKDRYLLSATVRRDGSSKFATNNRYATFPAASLGWVFSEEAFMNAPDWLNFGKLRLSWGKTGNQDGIGNYAYLPLAAGGYNYDALTGLSVTNIGNEDLKWETSEQTNIGLDLSFLRGRISFTYDYFDKTSDDLLYNVPVLATSGFTSRTSNIGSMKNTGHEFSLNSVNIDNERFSWNTNLNMSFIKNEVTSLLGDEPIVVGGWNAIIEGQPLGVMYGYTHEGIYQTIDEIPQSLQDQGVRPGDVIFADLDNNGVINSEDRGVIGSAMPDFSGGITNTFRLGAFDASIFATFSVGNDIASAWRNGLDHMGARDYNNLADTYYDRWTGPGTSNWTPRVTKSGYNLKNSSYYVEDASYLRIKSLTVGYTLPSGLTQRIGMDHLRVYATAVNLLTFSDYSGYDPEASMNTDARSFGVDNLVTPQPRSFMIGLNVNF